MLPQMDVARGSPGQCSATAPLDQRTPSATTPVPETPETSRCRTKWNRLGARRPETSRAHTLDSTHCVVMTSHCSNNAYTAQYALHSPTLHIGRRGCTMRAGCDRHRAAPARRNIQMANYASGPSVQLRRLAIELRTLREAAQLSRQQVMDRTGVNDVTLYRIERGKTRPQQRTLSTLLDLYKADTQTRDRLVEFASTTRFPGWIRPFRSQLGDTLTTYLSFESEASSARSYQAMFIPGLLQTEDYMRSMFRTTAPLVNDEGLEIRVAARLKRQAVLAERADPMKHWSIIDEAALRRQVGSTTVMSAQLKRLLDASERPETTIQVIPFDAGGAYPGMGGEFIHLRFDDPANHDIVCHDTTFGVAYEDSPDAIRERERIFEHMCAVALSPERTRLFIARIIAEQP